jgi:phosphohistidine phosphatase SixA
MRAYLVQHGEAHPEEVSPERELTPRGRSDVERVATLLANGGVRVAKVYHSGKTRARQTAELFARRLAPGVTSEAARLPSRPRGFHPQSLTEPCLRLSNHTARLPQEGMSVFHRAKGSSRFRLANPTAIAAPFAPWTLHPLQHYYEAV